MLPPSDRYDAAKVGICRAADSMASRPWYASTPPVRAAIRTAKQTTTSAPVMIYQVMRRLRSDTRRMRYARSA